MITEVGPKGKRAADRLTREVTGGKGSIVPVPFPVHCNQFFSIKSINKHWMEGHKCYSEVLNERNNPNSAKMSQYSIKREREAHRLAAH